MMKKSMTLTPVILMCITLLAGLTKPAGSVAQSTKLPLQLGAPVIVDSAESLIIPVLYNPKLFSSPKIAFWGNYYANLIFYNIKTDSSKRAFEKDTYIMNFAMYHNDKLSYPGRRSKNTTDQWVLMRVKDVDYNKNGRIDEQDPDILFVCDIYGKNLKRLTTEHESVVSIEIFEKQKFALIRFQRDSNHDGDYRVTDEDYYYCKLDLETLTLGNKIEVQRGLPANR